MSATGATWDDKAFKQALKGYLDLRKNVDPKKELKRRAKNVGLRLIKLYKEKGVNLNEINAKVEQLKAQKRVKIRPKIRLRKWGAKISKKGKILKPSYDVMANAELKARRSAKGFTATGWFPSVQKLGGNPRREMRPGSGPRRGKLIEQLSGSKMSETLVNQQPGAAHTQEKNFTLEQQALDAEAADMVNYITKKQNEAARRNGL